APRALRPQPAERRAVRDHDPVPRRAALRPARPARRGEAVAMPTRKLVTRYEDDLALFPDLYHKLAIVAGAILLVAFPLMAGPSWLTVGNQALVAIVGAVGLMILTGFCGQISLGHAAFLAIGAFTTSTLGGRYQLPFWLCLPIAGAVSALV